MIVFVVVVGVAVRVPVEDPIQMAVRVRMGIVGFVGRAGFGPFAHAVRFGPNVGKARKTPCFARRLDMAATRKKTTRKKTTTRKKKSTRKYSPAAGASVRKEMDAMKAGKLRSGRSGKKVTSRKQAIAIGLSEARRAGKKVPKKKKS
jgi:hypothetical protein